MKKSKRNRKREQSSRTIPQSSPNRLAFAEAAACLVEIGKGFHARGWVLGTSGNFSAVISHEPLRLAITSTGLDKGCLTPAQFLEMDEAANVIRGDGRPSAEALLHLAIACGVDTGAILHTHSVWSTVLSGSHASQGGIALEGYEMLKGLEGVRTPKHIAWRAGAYPKQTVRAVKKTRCEVISRGLALTKSAGSLRPTSLRMLPRISSCGPTATKSRS